MGDFIVDEYACVLLLPVPLLLTPLILLLVPLSDTNGDKLGLALPVGIMACWLLV